MKNKKAFALTITTIFAVAIAVALLVFGFSGGLAKTYEISKILASIPTWIWVAIGILALVRLLFGGRRR